MRKAVSTSPFGPASSRVRPSAPQRREPRPKNLPWFRLSILSGAVIGGLCCLAYQQSGLAHGAADSAETGAVAEVEPAWEPIARALPAYAVAHPALESLPFSTEARRHVSGGREDTLSYGSFAGSGPHLHLVVTRGVPVAESSFYLDLARRSAQAGHAVLRSGLPVALTTKFGPGEAADAALSGGAERSCLAFRLGLPADELALSGWLCGLGATAQEPQLLACLIDGLVSTGIEEDAELAAVFARAERARLPACAPPVRHESRAQPAKPRDRGGRAIAARKGS